MISARIFVLTSLAMIAFAANSILCRLALKDTAIDAASFTTIRLVSGATILWLIVVLRRFKVSLAKNPSSGEKQEARGDWLSALVLYLYAAGFSFAYISLATGTGALLLFGAVQATMIFYALCTGERLLKLQILGLLLALAGLVGLLLPGLSAPPLKAALLMVIAGIAWGAYSLRGKGVADATQVSAGNFLRAAPIAVFVSIISFGSFSFDLLGLWYGVLSGALASGVGYALWYTALPALKSSSAATVQLCVPVIAAIGGFVVLGESIDLRMVLASAAILGGIALVLLEKKPKNIR